LPFQLFDFRLVHAEQVKSCAQIHDKTIHWNGKELPICGPHLRMCDVLQGAGTHR